LKNPAPPLLILDIGRASAESRSEAWIEGSWSGRREATRSPYGRQGRRDRARPGAEAHLCRSGPGGGGEHEGSGRRSHAAAL